MEALLCRWLRQGTKSCLASGGAAHAVQGLSRLSMVFTQLGVAALAVGVVHILEAASRHPPMTKVAASLFFAIAGVAYSAFAGCAQLKAVSQEGLSKDGTLSIGIVSINLAGLDGLRARVPVWAGVWSESYLVPPELLSKLFCSFLCPWGCRRPTQSRMSVQASGAQRCGGS